MDDSEAGDSVCASWKIFGGETRRQNFYFRHRIAWENIFQSYLQKEMMHFRNCTR